MVYLNAQGRHLSLKLSFMSNNITVVSWIISAIFVFCVVVQKNSINKLTELLERNIEVNQVLEHYVIDSFREETAIRDYQIVEISNAYLTDSTLVVYLPFSLCRACFSSLVFSLQDNDFPFQNVTVLSERENLEIQSECMSRGIKNNVLNVPYSDVGNIILTKRGRDGQIVSMRYNLGDGYIVQRFLSSASSNRYGTK